MTYKEKNRNLNEPAAERRPAERLNAAERSESKEAGRDFREHVQDRADAPKRQGAGVIDRERYERQMQGLAEDQKAKVLATAEDLVKDSGKADEQAVFLAMREETQETPHFTKEEKVSPDVSLEHPHGPEGASHGGRDGRDPLQVVEDATPTGTNAYSATRGAPAEQRKKRDE